jgi:hypothetical protein
MLAFNPERDRINHLSAAVYFIQIFQGQYRHIQFISATSDRRMFASPISGL